MMEHLLAIADLSRAQIERLLDEAASFAGTTGRVEPGPLAGAVVANLFLEPSTRTRVSFEVAAKRLGGDVVNIAAAASSGWSPFAAAV